MTFVSKLGSNAKNIWREQTPLHYLQEKSGARNCVLLLNRPLDKYKHLIKHLWKSAVIRACADGALNQLEKVLGADAENYKPDIVCGDFDSVTKEVLESYRQKGTDIVLTPSQDDTDFTKTLQVMMKKLEISQKLQQYDSILCMGAYGGRFDHIMANINTLFKASSLQEKPCYLISPSQLICLLQPGSHIVHVNTGFEGDWCGLIPIGSPANHVYTTGLKWNLDGECLKFGSLISTSNTFKGNELVTVETTDPLLWAMSIKDSS